MIGDDLLRCHMKRSFVAPFTFRPARMCEVVSALLATILCYKGPFTLGTDTPAPRSVRYIVNVNYTTRG